MIVGPTACHGTIGGGQLEYMVIDAARAMLARGEARRDLDIPLGPGIGQCCGGHVMVTCAAWIAPPAAPPARRGTGQNRRAAPIFISWARAMWAGRWRG